MSRTPSLGQFASSRRTASLTDRSVIVMVHGRAGCDDTGIMWLSFHDINTSPRGVCVVAVVNSPAYHLIPALHPDPSPRCASAARQDLPQMAGQIGDSQASCIQPLPTMDLSPISGYPFASTSLLPVGPCLAGLAVWLFGRAGGIYCNDPFGTYVREDTARDPLLAADRTCVVR